MINLTDAMLVAKVANYVNNQGMWDWNALFDVLPRNIYDFIAAVPPPASLAGNDVPAWKCSHNGNFSIKSTFMIIANDIKSSLDPFFWLIWKWKGLKRVRVFLWQATTGSLMTKIFAGLGILFHIQFVLVAMVGCMKQFSMP